MTGQPFLNRFSLIYAGGNAYAVDSPGMRIEPETTCDAHPAITSVRRFIYRSNRRYRLLSIRRCHCFFGIIARADVLLFALHNP